MTQTRSADVTTAASRDTILDAAEHLMAEIGYDRASISMICKRSGLPVGSLYHHFGSKAGLLSAVMDRGFLRFYQAMPKPGELSGSAEHNMRDYWGAAAAAIAENATYFYLESDLTRFAHDDPDVAKLIERTRHGALAQLGALIEPYALELGVPDPQSLTPRLVAFTVAFTRGAIVEAGRDIERLRRLMNDLYLALRALIIDAAGPGDAASPHA